jgi:hypothetical protein
MDDCYRSIPLARWRGVLDRGDVANHPGDWLMGWLDAVAKIPGLYPAALIATGVVVGVWIDWLLKRMDGSRASQRKTLGLKHKDKRGGGHGTGGGGSGKTTVVGAVQRKGNVVARVIASCGVPVPRPDPKKLCAWAKWEKGICEFEPDSRPGDAVLIAPVSTQIPC